MKINKKGFTLIELLIVIAVLGIVLSVGTYFTIKSIKNSKEVAYETTLKGLYSSAATYANEFLEDTDWVYESKQLEDGTTEENEYACVNAWWLVNKGYLNKNNFSDNKEENKLNKSDIVVLYRNPATKVQNKVELNVKSNCQNTMSADLKAIGTTTNSISVVGTCKVKGEIPKDIKYEFCNAESCSGDLADNKYTFANLTDDTLYSLKLICKSNKFGEEKYELQSRTNLLELPTVADNGNNEITVDFNNDDNYQNLTKTVAFDASNISGTSSNGTYTDKQVTFDISKASKNKITGTATVSDGTNTKNAPFEAEKAISGNDLSIPKITASDTIVSNNWHNKNFKLIITSTNTVAGVYYEFSTNKTNWEQYNPITNIPINTETKSTTYYARACVGSDNCTKSFGQYVVKLDTTPPTIDVKFINPNNTSANQNGNYTACNSNSSCSNGNEKWIDFYPILKFTTKDSISGSSPDASPSYNYPYLSQLTGEFISGSIVYGDELIENGVKTGWEFSRQINSPGNRVYKLTNCDIAKNCSTKIVYFKIDTSYPELQYQDGTKYKFVCNSLSGVKEMVYTIQKQNGTYVKNHIVNSNTDNITINSSDVTGNGDVTYTWVSCRNNAGADGKVTFNKYDYKKASKTCPSGYELYSDTQCRKFTGYIWNCSVLGASGNRFMYGYSDPYPGHCGRYGTNYSYTSVIDGNESDSVFVLSQTGH